MKFTIFFLGLLEEHLRISIGSRGPNEEERRIYDFGKTIARWMKES